MPLWKSLADDVRNWGVNTLMTILVGGIIFLVAPILASIKKAIAAEPVPWFALFAVGLFGLCLIAVAVIALLKGERHPQPGRRGYAQGQRESKAMLNAIVDKLSAGVKPLRALQEVHVDELETNDMLLQLRDDLIKFRRTDPFQNIKDTIPEDRWLEFLQAARLQGLNLSDELQLLDLLQDKTPFIKPVEPAPQVFRKPTPQPIGDEIRDSICRKIKELIKGGDELLGRMMMGFPQIDAKFNQWSQRCEEYLRDSLTDDAVKLFRSPAIIPPDSNPIGGVTAAMLGEQWNPQRHLYERIASRVSRLREILNRVNEGDFC